MITELRPKQELPISFIEAMNEADRLGIKNYKSYIAFHIGTILESGENDDLITFLLFEIQKRDINSLISLESWLIEKIADHKSKGQLIQFKKR